MKVAALALEALCCEAELNDAVTNKAVTASGRHRFVRVIQVGVIQLKSISSLPAWLRVGQASVPTLSCRALTSLSS